MVSIKRYLRAISYFEQEQDHFDKIVKFLSAKHSTLLDRFCEGEIYLPSFMLAKRLKAKYKKWCHKDEELNRLFSSLIICTKLFYLKMIKAIEKDKKDNYKKYEKEFEKAIQPLGQQVINILTNIKYRLKIVRLKEKYNNTATNRSLRYILTIPFHYVKNFINNIFYKITLMNSMYHRVLNKLYYALILIIITTLWLVNYKFLNNISLTSSIFIDTICSLMIILLAMIACPISDFGKKDILGKNMVAYRYKVLFNNKDNSKLLKISAMQL